MNRITIRFWCVLLAGVLWLGFGGFAMADREYQPCPSCGIGSATCMKVDNNTHLWYDPMNPECDLRDPRSDIHEKSSIISDTVTCTSGGTVTYHCDECNDNFTQSFAASHNPVHHSAKAATCTEIGWAAYDTCNRCDYSTYTEIAALGHNYKASVTKPTCTHRGYTTYKCQVCGDSYTTDKTKALSHWYGLWTPNGDGTHSADCRRVGCKYTSMTDCMPFEVSIDSDVLTVCPTCGQFGDHTLEAIPDCTSTAIASGALPRGELIVRGIETPFDGALYAFTAAYEFAGRIEPFKGTVLFSVPLELAEAFKLVRVDVTAATETTERIEAWTEIPYSYEEGILAFETDAAGLFLLLPIE